MILPGQCGSTAQCNCTHDPCDCDPLSFAEPLVASVIFADSNMSQALHPPACLRKARYMLTSSFCISCDEIRLLGKRTGASPVPRVIPQLSCSPGYPLASNMGGETKLLCMSGKRIQRQCNVVMYIFFLLENNGNIQLSSACF